MYSKLTHLRASWRHFVAAAAVALFVGMVALTAAPQQVASQSASPITGWAWSDTIGWISVDGTGYGLSMDSNGFVTGYAWSDNIGWVKFDGLGSYPSGAGTTAADARVVSGKLTGWARACAGTENGDCSTMTSRTDGWDGWISLGGTGYGVTFDDSTGAFGSFAWGDVNVGWVDFSRVSVPLSCQVPPHAARCGNPANGEDPNARYDSVNNMYCSVCAYQCINGACISPPSPICNIANGSNPKKCIEARPPLVSTGNTGAEVSWDVSNVRICTGVTSNDNESWSAPVVSDRASRTVTSKYISLPQTIFTLACTGLDNNPYSWTATVQYAPSFYEF